MRQRRSRVSTGDGATGRVADARTDCPIVGIGASAGGLDAFKSFFTVMPTGGGMAFVLIQHLDPTRESLTAELVGTYTSMPVVQAEDGMRVEPDHVYVIPPNAYLSIRERTLRLTPPTVSRSLRMAVDFFLRSLGEDQREKAIGIILSGTGTDGTLGLKEIKAAGGMTMVQNPQTAQHDGMPRSAIATGCADYILPAAQMGDALLAYVDHAYLENGGEERLTEHTADSLARIVALLRTRSNFDFSGYKPATLRRRIQRRMSLQHLDRIPAYVERLRSDSAEMHALFQDLLLNVTRFFRDPPAWQFLQERVIRRLVTESRGATPLRAWVPGCSSGEEAYSLAMLLIEEAQAAGAVCPVQVFASDVDAEALELARAGAYSESIAADVTPARLTRFFVKDEHSYRVRQELRDTVVFAQQNLIADPPFSKLDIISCRNLLIYIEPALQEKILGLLHFAMVEGGYLFLGSAENVAAQKDLFAAVSGKYRIYRRIGPTRHDRVQFPVTTARGALAERRSPGGLNAARLATLAQQQLLERYAPVCVIINRTGEILYFHGATDEYLAQPTGLPTRNVITQGRNGLRTLLRDAVHQAIRENQPVVVTGGQVRRGSAMRHVRIAVQPFNLATETEALWLVSFADEPERAAAATAVPTPGAPSPADADLVKQLEDELTTTKEDLRLTIEDLRASNEELMLVNEELQSSNEELETSKEELQSLNEELSTVNSQLEDKVGELETANNDLDNLLNSTRVATLFLDPQLHIRRFTPAATGLFSLIPADVGRSISDIVQKFTDPALLPDIEAVLQRATPPAREVQAHDGRWYVRQVLPYLERDNRAEGVVITFSDVAAEALHEARIYAESIVDTVRESLLVLGHDLRVLSANRSFYNTFHVSPQETVGQLLYALGDHQWDIPGLRAMLGDVLPRKHVLNDFEVEHDFESIGPRTMQLNARILERGGDRAGLILLAIEDITDRKQNQQALREGEARKQVEEQVRQRQAELAHMLRITTVGELASGLAHELNQPLSAIANGVEACARHVRSGKAQSKKLLELLQDASSEALRAAEIVEHLRGFVRKGEPQFERTDLGEIVRVVPRLMRHELEHRQITLQVNAVAQPLPIRADRIQIEQVMVNLLQNAIDATRDVPRGQKAVQLRARAVNGMAEVAVRDAGRGLSAADAKHMFEPFFTTKPDGLGLGLAISRSIIDAHGGKIWVERSTGGKHATTIRFTLPLRPKPKPKRRAT